MTFPPLPPWEGAHPIIVHLPLGSLPVAALLAICAAFAGRQRRVWAVAALLVLAVGTLGLVFAAASGRATEEFVDIPSAAAQLRDQHRSLGLAARNLFLGLASAYALITAGAFVWADRFRGWRWLAAHGLFLAVLGYGLVNLANTSHLGGTLVHQYSVHAPLNGESPSPAESKDTPSDHPGLQNQAR